MKGLLFSFSNSVATVDFMFVLPCYEFLHQTLPRNVPKCSSESNSVCLEVYSDNSLLLSSSCHLSIQTISQVLLRKSSNFLWSSLFLSSDLLKSCGINQPVISVLQNCFASFCVFSFFQEIQGVTFFQFSKYLKSG